MNEPISIAARETREGHPEDALEGGAETARYAARQGARKPMAKTGPRNDFSGMKFGRLTVLVLSPLRDGGNYKWTCLCDCGVHSTVRGAHLSSGRVKSCGCLSREITGQQARTHGGTGTRTYKSWVKMRERCLDPNNNEFHNYGQRGITVCERWLNSFANFRIDMGERPLNTSLDRIDLSAGYSSGNCQWATDKEQARNRRTTVGSLALAVDILALRSAGLGPRRIARSLGIMDHTAANVIYHGAWQ